MMIYITAIATWIQRKLFPTLMNELAVISVEASVYRMPVRHLSRDQLPHNNDSITDVLSEWFCGEQQK
jgi:hypothetical protein